MAVYGPRIIVHPDRYGADRSAQSPMVKWLILHTSEQSGAEDPDDAEDIGLFLTKPGDRPTSSGGRYGASYHAITDTDRIIPATEDHLVAFAAGGANRYGLHLVIPVRIRPRSDTDTDANTSRTRWLDPGSRPYITRAAEWLIDKSRQHDVPLQGITADQMADGVSGYCDHWTASRAFRKSTHTDVGPHFPWDVLEHDIAIIVNSQPTPIPEEDLPVRYILPPPPERAGGPWFLRWDGTWSYLTGVDRDLARDAGLPEHTDLPSRYDLVRKQVGI